MTQLTWLSLRWNDLFGTILSALGQLTNLSDIYLYGNYLSGTVPQSLCQLPKSTELWINCDTVTCPNGCECTCGADP